MGGGRERGGLAGGVGRMGEGTEGGDLEVTRPPREARAERRARGTSSYNLAVNFKSSMPARGARARRTQVRISAAREDDCARQARTRHDATVA